MIIFLSKKGIGESNLASISVFHAQTKPHFTSFHIQFAQILRLAISYLLQPRRCTKPTFSISISMPMSPPASKVTDSMERFEPPNFCIFCCQMELKYAEMTSCFRQHTWTHTSNHYSISSIDDLIDVIDALLILNLPEVSDHPICWYHPMPPMD